MFTNFFSEDFLLFFIAFVDSEIKMYLIIMT